MEQFDQIVLADKPAGISSFGVVARVRRQLSEQAGRKIKVGHTGTLDPFATGLMILLSGTFTRRAGEFSKLDKVYEATIRLGAISSTGDPEGEITEQLVQDIPSEQQVRQTIKTFLGKITQTPPVFSAIKINGQRAYKLARAGQAVEMPSREVEIYSIELLSYEYPHIKIRAHVSSGTYIRTLAQDIGDLLGTGAYATELRRVKVGQYDIKDAVTIVR
ncbi:MAG TPA: tRNA pseudouridine(55) synthase TruB [Candidatus Nanoperiomorbaceae bacterium]|nr:tRNA pseudouridine(55) synthase TruB [Candidatus Nanoperiomorbaceae bacterium]HMQ97061.1 tRNA pseudouridine(55) synthase TruB [Candidatus Nanoperiomorbaceae bacterium]HMR85952.1 tRNA pseudouridine(55) synthase TruB [Candidatus Nanoperiomorbaceae bacterium]